MSASDDARHAIANAIDDDRTLSLFGYTRAAHALAAVMPDGRSIGQWLDDGEVAMSIVRVLVDLGRIGSHLQEFRPDCDDLTGPRGDGPPVTCRQCWPANPEEWCATCELVHTLEEADRG